MARPQLLRLLLAVALVALAIAGCSDSSGEETSEGSESIRTTLVAGAETEPKVPPQKGDPPKDLVVKDLRKGYGLQARRGDLVVTKLVAEYITGEPFESSWSKGGGEFIFQLGEEEANPGWEKGIPGMQVGGRRLLVVPPDEGSRFGTVGEGKPKDTLVYVVELIAILPPELKDRKEPNPVAPDEPAPKDLQVRNLIEGTGPAAKKGDLLTVQYVGIRYDGRDWTNSWKRNKQFDFELGAGEPLINDGWERGLQGMRVGGRRELIVPPKLMEGGEFEDNDPSDTLIYVVDLLGITEPPPGKAGESGASS
jgi:peptidylprolyl isomerase